MRSGSTFRCHCNRKVQRHVFHSCFFFYGNDAFLSMYSFPLPMILSANSLLYPSTSSIYSSPDLPLGCSWICCTACHFASPPPTLPSHQSPRLSFCKPAQWNASLSCTTHLFIKVFLVREFNKAA